MFKNYYIGSHIDFQTDITPLIMCINLHGEKLIGLELGVSRSDSFMTLLANCPNIETLIGVDPYLPYEDLDGKIIDGIELEMIKQESFAHHKYSEHKNKIRFIEKTSKDAVTEIKDNSLDFIFIDANHSYESVLEDCELWYPKVKSGGLFLGHDYYCESVALAVNTFRKKRSISANMSIYLSCYAWIK